MCLNCCNSPSTGNSVNQSFAYSQPPAIQSQVSLHEPEELEPEMIIAEEIVLCSESEDSASDVSFCNSEGSQQTDVTVKMIVLHVLIVIVSFGSCPKPV